MVLPVFLLYKDSIFARKYYLCVMLKAAVVILNWNTRALLERFLPEVLASVEAAPAKVYVADNGSGDGSVAMLRERFPAVGVIALDDNYGFTGGYNRALEGLEAEYFILMNSDIEVPRDWLAPLLEYMESHPDCGACGPKLLSLTERDRFEYAGAAGGLLDRYGYPFCRGRVLGRTEKDRGQYDAPHDVLWASGACLLVRSRLWRELGGLDGRFFAHMEEIDFCWRLQLAGWRVSIVPESRVWHLGGATLPKRSPWKLELNYRNNLLLLDNNLPATIGPFRARVRIFIRQIWDGLSAIVYLCTGRPRYAAAVFRAHRAFRRLRKEKPLRPAAVPDARVAGLYRGWIIPETLLKGDRVFEKVRTI